MSKYRIRKSNVPPQIVRSDGTAFVRVSSNADGLTLDRIAFEDLPVVTHRQTGELGRRATVITHIESDPVDQDYVLCTTRDIVLPYDERDVAASPEIA